MSKPRSRKQFERELTRLDRTAIHSFDSFEAADRADRQYWWSLTPIERLIALEHIRRLAWGYDDNTRPGLPRSGEVLKLRRRKVSGGGRVRRQLSRASS